MQPIDVRRTAVESFVCERVARRWAKGDRVSPNAKARLDAAATRLGFALPSAGRVNAAPAATEPATGAWGDAAKGNAA